MEISFFPVDRTEGITVEMAHVPRIGESIVLDGETYEIITVTWQPEGDDIPDVVSEVR